MFELLIIPAPLRIQYPLSGGVVGMCLVAVGGCVCACEVRSCIFWVGVVDIAVMGSP
jgi:hypothetical protein